MSIVKTRDSYKHGPPGGGRARLVTASINIALLTEGEPQPAGWAILATLHTGSAGVGLEPLASASAFRRRLSSSPTIDCTALPLTCSPHEPCYTLKDQAS